MSFVVYVTIRSITHNALKPLAIETRLRQDKEKKTIFVLS